MACSRGPPLEGYCVSRCIAHVDHLPPEGSAFEVRLTPPEATALLRENGLSGVLDGRSVAARVRVVPGGNAVFVMGTLQGTVAATCGRCLEPFEAPVQAEFHLTYVAATQAGQGGEVELHREDLDLEVLQDGAIDLDAVVAEQYLLQVPSHPACSDTCRGLCPVCGSNRNQEPCACGDSTPDPRFALLAGFRKDDPNPE